MPDGCADILVVHDGVQVRSRLSSSIPQAVAFAMGRAVGARRTLSAGGEPALFSEALDCRPDATVDLSFALLDFAEMEKRLVAADPFATRHEIMKTTCWIACVPPTASTAFCARAWMRYRPPRRLHAALSPRAFRGAHGPLARGTGGHRVHAVRSALSGRGKRLGESQ